MRRMFFDITVTHLQQFQANLSSTDFRDQLQTWKKLQETRDFSMPDIPVVTF